MEHYKWLAKAAAHPNEDGEIYRPVLSWGHFGLFRDQECVFTSDGYRLHISFTIPADCYGSFPFPFSQEGDLDKGMHPPDINALSSITKSSLLIDINTESLTRAIRGFAADDRTGFLVVRGETIFILVDDVFIHCNGFMDTGDDMPEFAIGFNTRYLYEAIYDTPHCKLRIAPKNPEHPLVIEMGQRLAIIMPMHTLAENSFVNDANALATLEATQRIDVSTLRNPRALKFMDDKAFTS